MNIESTPSNSRIETKGWDFPFWVDAVAVVLLAIFVGWLHLLPLSLGRLAELAESDIRSEVEQSIATRDLDADETAAQVEAWISMHRVEFEARRQARFELLRNDARFQGDDGRDYVFLGDYDSYTWLRQARTYLASGTTCDAIIEGQCRDTYTHAPVGAEMRYGRSLHSVAIALLHRLLDTIHPKLPLSASAFLIPVLVATLGIVPAYAIGRRFAGPVGGAWAVVLMNSNPLYFQRSAGSDNDVWNVVLPLWGIWSAIHALAANRPGRRVFFAVLTAAFTALHAATWSGWVFNYGVILVGLFAILFTDLIRAVWREGEWCATSPRSSALVFVLFFVVSAGATVLLDSNNSFGGIPAGFLRHVFHPSARMNGASPDEDYWPDILATVSELKQPDLREISLLAGGVTIFFIGWLGLLLLVLPRRGWRSGHFAILLAGNFLYFFLLTTPTLGQIPLILCSSLPLVAAIGASLFQRADGGQRESGALLLVVWFVAALYESYNGRRFIMLLVPPFALAAGVAVGRLHLQLNSGIDGRLAAKERIAKAALLGLFLVAVAVPASPGYKAARSFLPRMNRAWWEELQAIRRTTPPESIINTWWDFGYFVKYAAERRVSADGSSLNTHIPYWLARALVAEEEGESLGLLRMLNCASDATPFPEGRFGAYAKLLEQGIRPIQAQPLVIDLARRDAGEARSILSELGMTQDVQHDVLASTHCDPPPSYLILTSEMTTIGAWRSIGRWDFRKAFRTQRLREGPRDLAVDDLVHHEGLDPQEAQSLYDKVRSLDRKSDIQSYLEPAPELAHWEWLPCDGAPDSGELHCPVGLDIDENNTLLRGVILSTSPTLRARFALQTQDDSEATTISRKEEPANLLVASESRLEVMDIENPGVRNLAVLFDQPGRRILIASPRLLRSTFAQLMFLDGRFTPHFRKMSSHTSARDETVTTWEILWNVGVQADPAG